MNKVVYHSADFDGIFCREIAKKYLGLSAEYVGWNFGQPPIEPARCPNYTYVLDLAPAPCLASPVDPAGLIWIDHHKTSIDAFPNDIAGYRIDGVAACRLAWQWFNSFDRLPTKQEYIDRMVIEPTAVRLAGEYDIWDKRDPAAEIFQYSLRSCNEVPWDRILKVGTDADDTIMNMLIGGRICQTYARRNDESICKSSTWIKEWEGLKFLCINHGRFNSLLFAAKDTPETGHDALMGFKFDGKHWAVSLYHARHRTDIDLSAIAVKHGGGGHRGACGFTCDTLPFSLP